MERWRPVQHKADAAHRRSARLASYQVPSFEVSLLRVPDSGNVLECDLLQRAEVRFG